MALKFKNPAFFIISGPSGVGKTKWIPSLVYDIDKICSRINQIFYCYKVWQGIFNEYSEKIRCRQGPPVLDDFKEFENCLFILDDMMLTENSFLSKIFTIYSHHYRFSVFFTTQNLFHKGLRELLLNAKFMVLFKNCRDKNQVSYFFKPNLPSEIQICSPGIYRCDNKPSRLFID